MKGQDTAKSIGVQQWRSLLPSPPIHVSTNSNDSFLFSLHFYSIPLLIPNPHTIPINMYFLK